VLLRRVSEHVKDQNWFAVFVDFLIVVIGILLALQITNWNDARQATYREKAVLAQLEEEFIEIKGLLEKRHRASSAVEGFNAALRPYLYVHKGVTENFLELFRAYYNLRTRRWGRHKDTSAHECLTGTPVTDWLALLGYPPSSPLH